MENCYSQRSLPLLTGDRASLAISAPARAYSDVLVGMREIGSAAFFASTPTTKGCKTRPAFHFAIAYRTPDLQRYASLYSASGGFSRRGGVHLTSLLGGKRGVVPADFKSILIPSG
jgi:hypothetical protein